MPAAARRGEKRGNEGRLRRSTFGIRYSTLLLRSGKTISISNTEWKSVSLKKETPSSRSLKGFRIKSGIVLLSRTVAGIVPLAPRGLTSLFEMGRGVTPSILTPENSIEKRQE